MIAGLGFVVLVVGVFVFQVMGHNYSVCQRWDVDPSQPACQAALTFHGYGVAITIVGILMIIGGLIYDHARRCRDGAKRPGPGPGRPEDPHGGHREDAGY